MAMTRTMKLDKAHVEFHVGAFYRLQMQLNDILKGLNCSHMYAGYFDKISRDVKCPKVTSKSDEARKKNVLLNFS